MILDTHGRRIEATESRYPADRYALDILFDVEPEPAGMTDEVLRGRLVLDDEVVPGRLVLEDGWIRAVEPDPHDAEAAAGPIYAPGFVDVHVHGWGGHDALGRRGRPVRHGPGAPPPRRDLVPAHRARRSPSTSCRGSPTGSAAWMPDAPDDGAQPLGFNLEGPFLAPERRGAHDPALLRTPAAMDDASSSDRCSTGCAS